MGKSGVIWVKVPVNNRTSRITKAWSKKFVVIEQKSVASVDDITSCVLVTIFSSENTKHQQSAINNQCEQPVKNHWLQFCLTPRKCVVFRCKSRSQPYSFTLCEDSDPKIHFSTKSESESHEWMKHIRNLLWPPSSLMELEKTFGTAFEVSIIDNEYTHRAGLLGTYGHMNISSKKACLMHPQTGHVIQEWYLNTISFKLLHQNNKLDDNKIITMIVDTKSSTGCGNIIFFCENAAEIINHVHSVRQMFEDSTNYGKQLMEQLENLEKSTETQNSGDKNVQLYATPRNDGRKVDVFDSPSFKFTRPMSDSFILDCHSSSNDVHTLRTNSLKNQNRYFGKRNIFNIPASMLNCSISSTLPNAANDSDSEDDQCVSNFPMADECFQSLEEENIYQEIDEVNEQLSKKHADTAPTTAGNELKENGIIPKVQEQQSNTLEINSQTELNDEKLSKLFNELQSLKLEHQEFITKIKQMLMTSTEVSSSGSGSERKDVLSNNDGKNELSSDYCVMHTNNSQNEASEAEYVDMSKNNPQ